MRKIEQQMIKALHARKNWGNGNTSVSFAGPVAEVFLFGNHIATLDFAAVSGPRVQFTLAGWSTPTTKSRLNAILREFNCGGIYTQRHHTYWRCPRYGKSLMIGSKEWISTTPHADSYALTVGGLMQTPSA